MAPTSTDTEENSACRRTTELVGQFWVLNLEPAREEFLIRRALATILLPLFLAVLLVCLVCPRACAGVGVVLNESMDTSLDRITGTGHTAVYFSRICPETPLKLRICRPDEPGSVMGNYINIGEDESPEWNIVPLNIYLYGVEDPRNRPLFGSYKIKRVLEDRYRHKYLAAYCQEQSCINSDKSEWREMIGATLLRSVHIFVVDTTLEQDLQLIAEFNAQPNRNHFNGITRNCADFTQQIINTYFPGATHTDYLNDFGMTSPKAVARTFTHYAERHPEAHFRVFHFAQVPGTIKRSRECHAGTEQLYRSKLIVPMLIFGSHELPFVAASYLLTGRFNAQHTFEQHPSLEASQANSQIQLAKFQEEDTQAGQLETIREEERARIVGTSKEWKEYKTALRAILKEDEREETIPDRKDLNRYFKRLDARGTPAADANGALWLDIPMNGETLRVGLSAGNLLASESDANLANELVLARARDVLKSPKHRRETMAEFKRDWAVLQAARRKSATLTAGLSSAGSQQRSTDVLLDLSLSLATSNE